jgi:hypothetical protein
MSVLYCFQERVLWLLQLKLNTDESPGIATEYGIRSIPTVMIFKDGAKQVCLPKLRMLPDSGVPITGLHRLSTLKVVLMFTSCKKGRRVDCFPPFSHSDEHFRASRTESWHDSLSEVHAHHCTMVIVLALRLC